MLNFSNDILKTATTLVDELSYGNLRQICETRPLLVQIWQGKSHFSQKWPLTNVGKSGESGHSILANLANP
jgi:hypothetical protein